VKVNWNDLTTSPLGTVVLVGFLLLWGFGSGCTSPAGFPDRISLLRARLQHDAANSAVQGVRLQNDIDIDCVPGSLDP
jgi:hypothetical protein